MQVNPQESLLLSIENSKDTLEFIKHQDYHCWIYINGVITDARLPRHDVEGKIRAYKSSNKDGKGKYILDGIWFGKSLYNQKRIKSFFVDLEPQFFV